jgi:urea carboxylase
MTGGLVTTCTVVKADFWRLGQCRPGDAIYFKRISWESALKLRQRTEQYLTSVKTGQTVSLVDVSLPEEWEDTVLARIPKTSSNEEVVFRQSGDSYLHVTYGPMISSALTRALVQYRVKRVQDMSDVIEVTGAVRGKFRHRLALTDSISRPVRSTCDNPEVSSVSLDGPRAQSRWTVRVNS